MAPFLTFFVDSDRYVIAAVGIWRGFGFGRPHRKAGALAIGWALMTGRDAGAAGLGVRDWGASLVGRHRVKLDPWGAGAIPWPSATCVTWLGLAWTCPGCVTHDGQDPSCLPGDPLPR
jgi:hypothetical protein